MFYNSFLCGHVKSRIIIGLNKAGTLVKRGVFMNKTMETFKRFKVFCNF